MIILVYDSEGNKQALGSFEFDPLHRVCLVKNGDPGKQLTPGKTTKLQWCVREL